MAGLATPIPLGSRGSIRISSRLADKEKVNARVQQGLSEEPRFGRRPGSAGAHYARKPPPGKGARGAHRLGADRSPDTARTLFQSPSPLSAEDARPSGVHASPPSVSDCLQVLSNTPLQPFSGRASPGHKREVAKAVVNALGGVDQLGYLLQMVLSSDQFCENVEERTSLAVSVVEASRALVNKDPEAPYRVLPTPPLPKVVSFAMECGLSRGKLMLARKHFPICSRMLASWRRMSVLLKRSSLQSKKGMTVLRTL